MTEQQVTRVDGQINVSQYQQDIEKAIMADESLLSRLQADVTTVTSRLERSRGKLELLQQMVMDISQPQAGAPVTALPQNGVEKQTVPPAEPFKEVTEEKEP